MVSASFDVRRLTFI